MVNLMYDLEGLVELFMQVSESYGIIFSAYVKRIVEYSIRLIMELF